ncbi:MAG: S8 family peptidase [Syntrophorhabdaceae bacterium]|nr:S8 family peptidase [Syntrophorhabdaceae bacterium]
MPDRPLLLFPTPEIADRSKRPGFPNRVHRPSHGRQGQRLSPIFTQLQTEFNARRVELQQTAAGADPEQVLVIETVGTVENFANAIKRIDGLEWMGEIETDEIIPDEDFYDESVVDKKLSGRLYLVMTNQRALQEILALWQRYQQDPHMEFDRGLTRFRDAFLCLKDIRRWGVRDRIEETGLLEVWRDDLANDGDRVIRFEVELWFRGNEAKQQQAREQLDSLIGQRGGRVLNDCIISDIAYHALLAEIPANAAQEITEHPDVDITRCEGVMFFRPVGQMATGKGLIEGELLDHEEEEATLPTGEPIIAILDGLPLANHSLLVNRLIIDDPDDYTSAYTVPDRTHGTAMASLVVHGDLSDETPPLSHPVYVRPIMKPIPWPNEPRPEQIPDDILVVDQIHRAVLRMFEREGAAEPSAPTIRIINFSIGDPCRQFNQVLSPLARLLDWLSVKYRVLFVISAGNHQQSITTGIPRTEFGMFSDREKEGAVVKALYRDARWRRIVSPAESINGITVGALHHDNATVTHMGQALNLFENILPSPVSAFGSGHRRAIKPDLVFGGGRVLYNELIGTTGDATLEFSARRSAPGNKVASPSFLAGDVNKVAYCCGTSNAAALISRMAGTCYDTLVDIFEEQAAEIELDSYITPLMKAMIVHGCSWGEIRERLQEILETPGSGRQIRSWISRWLGYGVPASERVMACTRERATLLGFGQLGDEEAHLFTLPLPPSLNARREWRRLTVTLAWMSPIAANTQRYRAASMWFEVEGGVITPNRQDADRQAVRRGTVQHEVFVGDRALPVADDANLAIKVNCRRDATKIQEPVPYGLAVSLEVAEGVNIAIYDEIRTRILSAIEIRARGDQ